MRGQFGTDIVVVGAGISGAATAYELACAGVGVTLIDRYGPAAMASGWTLAGVRASGRHAAELPLAQAAIADWEQLADKLDAPTHYTRRGNLRLALTEAHRDSLAAMVAAQRAAGLTLEMLDQDALHELAPAVAASVLGASYCPTDGHADPVATVSRLLRRRRARRRHAALRRAGRRDRDRRRAHHRRQDRARPCISCGGVVLATGIMGNALLAPLGLEAPMTPRAVTLLRTVPVAPVLEQVIGVADASCAGRQEADGRFRFTGSGGPWSGADNGFVDRAGAGRAPPGTALASRRSATSLAWPGCSARLVPAALDAPLDDTWIGLIDSTPDALAGHRTHRSGGAGAGHGLLGARLLPRPGHRPHLRVTLARGETPNLPIEPFALGRFDGADRRGRRR